MNMLVTTTDKVAGREIKKTLGIARGCTVRSKNIGRDIGAAFKSIVGGEVKSYTQMSEQAREEALNRMINQAIDMGADAVVNVRFSTSMIMQGASEMLAYGTAVKLK